MPLSIETKPESESSPIPDGALGDDCRLCGGGLVKLFEGHPGYQAPAKYDIFHCEMCETSMVSPMAAAPELYDFIYSHVGLIPGYQRYREHAEIVLTKKDPLIYLADLEDAYWAVWKHLEGYEKGRRPRILEVGCGLGYLTYSIAKRGHDVLGIDISREAIEQATKRYGAHYRHGDLESLGKMESRKFDLVIMTEVIEHVPDIPDLLKAIDALLVEGGEILITTPNKSVYPETVVWDTDPPPIHFWWLSETSMRMLASRLGHSIRFLDFSSPVSKRRPRVSKAQVLDESGRVRYHDGLALRSLKRLMEISPRVRAFVSRAYLFFLLVKKSIADSTRKRLFLCAIFRKPFSV